MNTIVTEIDGEAVVKVRLISGSLSTPVTVRLTTEDGSAIGVCIDSLTTLLSSKCSACLLVYLTCIEGDDCSSFVQDIVFSPGSVE